MQVSHSGLERLYLEPFPLTEKIPTIREFVKAPKNNVLFLEHVTMNHKGLNWKIYRYHLTCKNYKTFLYAFAYKLKFIDPSCSTSWLFESNANRLQKALKRANVILSADEDEVLNICLNFRKLKLNPSARKNLVAECQVTLVVQYNLLDEYLDSFIVD